MTAEIEISIANDFSRFPAGRYLSDGPFSGEKFREQLATALRAHSSVAVLLDGTMGYGSSFLEEAFGGLVRHEGFAAADLQRRLRLRAADESLIEEVWGYISSARPKKVSSG